MRQRPCCVGRARKNPRILDCGAGLGTEDLLFSILGAEVIGVCGAAYYSAIQKRAVTLDEFKDYCRSYTKEHGDGEEATLALLNDLMKPYALGGTAP